MSRETSLDLDEARTATNLLHLDVARRAQAALAAAGVGAVALKGVAMLATIYADDLHARALNDVDLLVDDGRRAVRVLARALDLALVPGAGVELAPRPGRPGHGVVRIDLVAGGMQRGGVAALMAEARTVAIPGGSLRVLAPEAALLVLVADALLIEQRLRPHHLEDLRRLLPLGDEATLLRLAARWRLRAPLALALGHPALAAQPRARALAARVRRHAGDPLFAHFLARRVAQRRAPGRAHLAWRLWIGDRRAAVVHLVRRACFGPELAEVMDAGFDLGEARRAVLGARAAGAR